MTVTGYNTNFVQNSTFVEPDSPMSPFITAQAVTVTSPTSFTVMLTATAPTSTPQALWVSTPVNAQEAVLPNAIIIQ